MVLGRPPIMPFIGGSVSISFGALTLITGDPMWVQIKVTLFNALVAFLLWIGLRTERNFFRFVFHKTFHFTEEGWHNLTRNAALFSLATAVANEEVRFGFADAHIIALNRVFTGIDIWMLFKIFIVMPATVVLFWWQVRLLQKHRQLNPLMYGGSRNGIAD
jgi:intracellular septation protein